MVLIYLKWARLLRSRTAWCDLKRVGCVVHELRVILGSVGFCDLVVSQDVSELSVLVADVVHRVQEQSLVERILVLYLVSLLRCWSMPLCEAPHLRSSNSVLPMWLRELGLRR